MAYQLNDFVKYSIKVAYKDITTDYSIKSIIVDKKINKIPYAKIVIYDSDLQLQSFSITNDKTFIIGATISIHVGYNYSNLYQIFEGIITKLAIQSRDIKLSTLTITCRDITYKTTMYTKTMHFVKSKDSEIFKKILSNYNNIKYKIEETTIIHENITQYEISDWDFLNIRSEANGKIIIVNDGYISIKKPKKISKSYFTYTYGKDFIDFDAEIDIKNSYSGINTISWDSKNQKKIIDKAINPVEKSMSDLSYKKLINTPLKSTISISHGGILDSLEIKNLATGLFNRSIIDKIKGTVTVSGNAELYHDSFITIKKEENNFLKDVYISGIQHIISDGNWTTTLNIGLDAERYMYKYNDINTLPAAGMMPNIHGLQLGIVKQITEDPQKNNRIFVHFPLIQDDPKEGIWCRIASFYATKSSGAFFIPELEDEVVIAFINDDIRFPIILGSLYSNQHKSPKKVENNNTFKSFISKEKLELTFHDDKEGPEIIIKTASQGLIKISDKNKNIEIVDQNANKIVLSNDGINLTSIKNINLNAMGSITIKSDENIIINSSKNIDFKSMNINAKASMKAILSGNASTEVKSSMATIIKGTTVLIN